MPRTKAKPEAGSDTLQLIMTVIDAAIMVENEEHSYNCEHRVGRVDFAAHEQMLSVLNRLRQGVERVAGE